MGQAKNSKKKMDNQEPVKKDDEAKRLEREIEEKEDNRLEEYGQVILEDNQKQRKIHLITIIGEVEGHENSSGSSKTTKYDHILPKLAEIEDDDSVDGLLVLLNTSGGDVDAGLAIADRIPGTGRQPFHRCAPGCFHQLLLYRALRDHDDPPGAHDRHGHRHGPDL